MESKTKHRILGVVVLAGLVILAYPFIQHDNAASSEQSAQAMVKAPAFPDQAIQVAASDEGASNPAAAAPSIQAATPTPDTAANVINTSTPEANTTTAQSAQPAAPVTPRPDVAAPVTVTAPETAAPTATPSTVEQTAPAPEQKQPTAKTLQNTSDNSGMEVNPAKPAEELKTALSQANEKSTLTQAVQHKKLAHAKTHKPQAVLMSKLPRGAGHHTAKVKSLDTNGLLKLKQSAWVIQLGSFKQKSNALKLVNKLRASGYRAFIQNINVASGESTRVFVGPEQHQASAEVVASELQNNMKLRGIIISYKPFTL